MLLVAVGNVLSARTPARLHVFSACCLVKLQNFELGQPSLLDALSANNKALAGIYDRWQKVRDGTSCHDFAKAGGGRRPY